MNRSLAWTRYLGFIALGVSGNLAGPLMPAIQAEIHLHYLEAGLVIAGPMLGVLIGVPLGGPLADRVGKIPLLFGSGILLALGLTGCALSSSFVTIFGSFVLTGVGGCGYEIAINALQAEDKEVSSGRGMSFLHLFYGVGATAGPLLAALALRTRFGWRLGFMLGALLPVLVTAALFLQPAPPPVPSPAPVVGGRRIVFSRTLWIFAATLGFYVGVETSVCGFVPVYWQHLPGAPEALVPYTASFVWGSLSVGRLLSGFISERLGLLRFVTLASAGAVALALLWAVFPYPAIVVLALFLLALSLAGIYPTVMAFVTGLHPADSGKVVAFMTLCASAGGFVLPPLVGKGMDAVGTQVLPALLAALAAVMLGGARWGELRGRKAVELPSISSSP